MKSFLRSVSASLAFATLAVLSGCSSSAPAVSVSVSPASGTTLVAGATQTFTATVTNDGTTTPGVTWSASVGTISATGLYTAPTPVTTTSATITATSKTDTTKTGTASVTLTPIAITIAPTTPTAMVAGATQAFTATVTGDPAAAGVKWSAPSGSFSSGTSAVLSGVASTYTAAPVSGATVVLTATSVSDPTKTATVSVPLTAVGVTATAAGSATTIATQGSLGITAAVTGDTALNQGVTWSVTGGTLSGSTTTGTTVTANSGASSVAVTATSKTDTSKTSTVTLSVNAISISLTPNTTTTLGVSQTQAYTASVTNDGKSQGVTWSILSGAGSLSGNSSSGVTYNAPTSVITAASNVTVIATSVTDSSKTATAAILLTPITVSFGTTTYTIDSQQQLSVPIPTVTYDGTNSGVAYGVTNGGTVGAPFLGSFVYTAPTVTTQATSTITASSLKDTLRTATVTITINPALTFTTPNSQVATLTAAQTNTAYNYQIVVGGGTGTKTFSIVSGAFPTGITMSSTGLISGTPAAVTTGSGVVVKVTDQSSNPSVLQGTFTINVTASPLVFNTPTLNMGTVGTAYSQQLSASGGTGALTYTVNTGTLAGTGLTLSSSGLLSGTPTADTAVAGTALTFKVTDSATPTAATQTTGSASLVINPIPLAVTTTSLPGGTAGVAYTTTLASTGGTGAVTWTQTAGTLPSPIALNGTTGVISGTVSAATTASGLAFRVTDTPDQGRTAQTATVSALSLAIVSGTPPTITTTTLPNGTLNTVYSQAIATTGGTAPFTWSISSGSVPAGLNINTSTGVISGTPTSTITVTNTFTVKIVDAGSQQTTQSYTIVCGPTLAVGANNSELNGTYAFLVNGMYNGNQGTLGTQGKVYGMTLIGSLTFNGTGSVTSGSIDHFDALAGGSSTTVTGSYTVGADNRGTIIINTGSKSFTFAIAVGGVSSGVASKIKLQQFDDINSSLTSASTATGTAKLQTAAAFVQPSGTYVFGLTGETPCNTCATVGNHFGTVNMVGYFAASGGTIASGTADATDYSSIYSNLGLTGTTVAPSGTTGRGTITLAVSGSTIPAMPTHFVYYVISSSEMYVASTDSHAASSNAFSMLSGDVQLQTISTYTSTSLSGNAIAWESFGSSGNGTGNYSLNSRTSILELQLTSGSTAISAINDENDGNNQAPNLDQIFAISAGVTYTLTTGGRLSLNGAGGGAPVFYFTGNGNGFAMDENGSGGGGGIYTMQQQTGGPFSIATLGSLAGTLVSVAPTGPGQGTSTGILTFGAGGGSGSLIQDNASPGSLSPGSTSAFTYTLDANGSTTGRNTASGGPVIYIISPTKAVAMDAGATGSPNITIVEK